MPPNGREPPRFPPVSEDPHSLLSTTTATTEIRWRGVRTASLNKQSAMRCSRQLPHRPPTWGCSYKIIKNRSHAHIISSINLARLEYRHALSKIRLETGNNHNYRSSKRGISRNAKTQQSSLRNSRSTYMHVYIKVCGAQVKRKTHTNRIITLTAMTRVTSSAWSCILERTHSKNAQPCRRGEHFFTLHTFNMSCHTTHQVTRFAMSTSSSRSMDTPTPAPPGLLLQRPKNSRSNGIYTEREFRRINSATLSPPQHAYIYALRHNTLPRPHPAPTPPPPRHKKGLD